MIERADAMASRLEGSVRAARSEAKPGRRRRGAGSSPRPAAMRPTLIASVGRASHAVGQLGDCRFDDERSEAERELLRALQAVR